MDIFFHNLRIRRKRVRLAQLEAELIVLEAAAEASSSSYYIDRVVNMRGQVAGLKEWLESHQGPI